MLYRQCPRACVCGPVWTVQFVGSPENCTITWQCVHMMIVQASSVAGQGCRWCSFAIRSFFHDSGAIAAGDTPAGIIGADGCAPQCSAPCCLLQQAVMQPVLDCRVLPLTLCRWLAPGLSLSAATHRCILKILSNFALLLVSYCIQTVHCFCHITASVQSFSILNCVLAASSHTLFKLPISEVI